MVKDHSDSKGYSFRSAARVLLYASFHRQDNTYHGICYTSRGALAGTREIAQWVNHEGSIRRPIAPCANALTTELHVVPLSVESAFGLPNPVLQYLELFSPSIFLVPASA